MALSLPKLAQKIPTEANAYKFLEDLRWGDDGRACPHCGSVRKHYFLTPRNGESRKTRTGTKSQRRVWKCADCRKQFSVLTGTIFHGSKIPVRTWVFVVFEMASSKNGVSAREIERKYDLTPKSAWFMCHRIREAMKREPMAGLLTGRVVVDETWIGGRPLNRHGHNPKTAPKGVTSKTPVVALVSRETGEVRSKALPNVDSFNLFKAMRGEVAPERTIIHTDQANYYRNTMRFAGHEQVNHEQREYVRGDVTTNQAECYFSQLKRSLDGTHHRVSVQHLPRYLAEFDFRYSTCKASDEVRMQMLVSRTGGRRLTYKPRSRRR